VKAKMRTSSLKAWTKKRRKEASTFFKEAFRTGALVPPHTGHKQTEYQKKKASEANRGKVLSQETRERLKKDWAARTPEQIHERTLPGILARCKVMSKRSEAESKVKSSLRHLHIRYRSQKPFLTYIADIYLPDQKLILECDGQGHKKPDQLKRDQERDRLILEGLYIPTFRISNKEILTNPVLAVSKALQKAGVLHA